MGQTFCKYSANGNNFILIDQRSNYFELNSSWVKRVCDQSFGVGADGVIELTSSNKAELAFKIWNSDGSKAAMCGNAIRSIASYYFEKSNQSEILIEAEAGIYKVIKEADTVWAEMDVNKEIDISVDLGATNFLKYFSVDTGVPHLVFLGRDLKTLNLSEIAPPYRKKFNTNVDLVEVIDEVKHSAFLKVYERGVEGETYSCGTAIAATALALKKWFGWNDQIVIETKGGVHQVKFVDGKLLFSGKVIKVFEGQLL